MSRRTKDPGVRWVPDEEVSKCFSCDNVFSFALRRHHCRLCGRVFCSSCCPEPSSRPATPTAEPFRRCRMCSLAPRCLFPVTYTAPTAAEVSAKPVGTQTVSEARVLAIRIALMQQQQEQSAFKFTHSAATGGTAPGKCETPPPPSSSADATAGANSPTSPSDRQNTTASSTSGSIVVSPSVASPSTHLDDFIPRTIVKFLPSKLASALMSLNSKTLSQFVVPGFVYEDSIQTRYPTFFNKAVIGKGGFGTVFRVYDRISKCYFAVKVLEKRNVLAFAHWRKLLEEIELTEPLEHQNIARLVDRFQTLEQVILVYEVGEGGTLRRATETVKKRSPNCLEAFVAHVIRQVAAGLKYIFEEHRIIHRDLKPENIVLSRDFSRVMIIDFGLAERVLSEQQKYVPCGTQGFAPPEVVACVTERKIRFEAPSQAMHQGDLFSLGVIAYSLLSGTKPFKGTKFYELHKEILQGIRCEGPRWRDVSANARSLVESLLHRDWRQRITCDQITRHPYILGRATEFSQFEALLREELQREDKDEQDAFVFVSPEDDDDAQVFGAQDVARLGVSAADTDANL